MEILREGKSSFIVKIKKFSDKVNPVIHQLANKLSNAPMDAIREAISV